jgi:small-conductance mechanosensitive channel
MLDRFRSELKAKIKKTGSIWGTTAGQKLNSVLSYEIAGDEDTPVTIGRLLELLLYVAVGIAIAYALTHVIARRLLPRLGLHHGTVSAIKSIMFYALCVGSAVAAFQLLQIPAEAFAFVGGAVAIAIGFGGQDIMNNFMSGIILLVERPIRTGDVVQLGGVQGVVLHIGLRSTRLQTDANHELIVPNKTLIDEQVTNLTLSDNFVQRFVTATLERDVPIDEAKRKMLEVVFRHPLVLKSPRPIVLLKEVETYWLTFEIHFWLEHGSFIKCAMVESDILEIIGDIYRPPKEDVEGKEDNVAAKSEDRVGDAAAATAASAATGPAGSSQVLGDMKKMSRAVLAKELKRSMRIKA